MGSVARRAWGALPGLLLAGSMLAARAEGETPSAAGCYFVSDGGGLLAIREEPEGTLVVDASWPQRGFDWFAERAPDGRLRLTFDFSTQLRRAFSLARIDEPRPTLVFAPSSGGDWVLVERAGGPTGWFPSDPGPPVVFQPALASTDARFGCVLHRVAEEPIRAYFEALEDVAETEPPQPAHTEHLLGLAGKILDGNPRDPAGRIVYVDALLRDGDRDELAHRVREWGPDFENLASAGMRMLWQVAEEAVEGDALEAEGRNARVFFDRLCAPNTNLDERFTMLPEALRFERNIPARSYVFETHPLPWLGISNWTKVCSVESNYMLLRGERDRARTAALASYRTGQLASQGGYMLELLIGMSVRAIAARDLELQLANACETLDEIEAMRTGLESLNELSNEWNDEEVFEHGVRLGTAHLLVRGLFFEAVVRHRLANQRLDLLRSAAAAKKYQIAAKAWPGTAQATNAMFAGDPPKDLFSGGWLLGGPRDGGFVVYSVGPDKVDDRAAFSYDPTNGTLSGGDLFVEIPAERRYPFSREPFRPKTHDDVARAFPNGLPPDPFAQTRMRPLTVHPDDPSVIFSFGPDFDEATYTAHGGKQPPQPQYDPTNGTVSRGNLYYRP